MSTAQQSTHRPAQEPARDGANWSAMNILAMAAGFVLFWPAGLFMLVWILLGRDVQELPAVFRRQRDRVGDLWQGASGASRDASDNVVFNEFQEAQYERIREIKDEMKARARRFRDYRANAKRRADEEEFNRFMADAPLSEER